MQSAFKALAVVAALVADDKAQIAVCDRADTPNWQDYEEDLLVSQNWYNDPTPIEGCNQANKCYRWTNGRYQSDFCFTTNDCVAVSHSEFLVAYRLIEQYCKPEDLGGCQPYTYGLFEVINNLDGSARMASDHIVEETMHVDEYRERFGGVGIPVKPTIDDKAKRQDVTWTNYVTKSGETYQVTQENDSGVEITWSEATSVSISVSATAGVSAGFFEIFSASLEISTSYEETNTITTALIFNSGDCPGAAIVYWDPLFERYTGVFSDNPGTTVEIYVTRKSNGEAEGRFRTNCIGSS